MVKKDKQDRMMTLKGIDEKINMLHSTASKYIESLEIYNGYKLFLDKLYGKFLSFDDTASSKPQEEIEAMVDEKVQQNRQRARNDDGMQDLHISDELREIYENDFPIPPPPFEDPSELIQIFSDMEEQNLLQIQRMQDAEQQLEFKIAQFNKTQRELNAKIELLKDNEANNSGKIMRVKQEKEALSIFEDKGTAVDVDRADMARIDT